MTKNAIFLLCLALAAAPAAAETSGSKSASATSGKSRGAAVPSSAKHAAASVKSLNATKAADDSMSIQGGQEGTVFKSLTVQGEDRIRLDFERPELQVELNPDKAPGLDWGSARDVLDRTTPDLVSPLVKSSSRDESPYLGHPWLSHFASGAVARFQPDVKGVESWKLSIVNARGEAVTSFSGRGEPPKEIVWDGRSSNGIPVLPGLTYSYVLEARDKAGNKRNFVGQGFKVNSYRFETAEGPTMTMTARELPNIPPGRGAAAAIPAPPILIEAASWLNQRPQPNQPVSIKVTARTLDEAQAMADFVTRSMSPYLIGDPARLQAVTEVQPDAPDGGTIRISPAK